MARHLSRGSFGMADEEIDELVARAEGMTVRALRAWLGGAEEERRVAWTTLTRRVERVDAVAFEGAVLLLNALGESRRTAAVEGMLVEGLVTLLNRAELDASLVARIAGPGPGAPAGTLLVGWSARPVTRTSDPCRERRRRSIRLRLRMTTRPSSTRGSRVARSAG